MEEVGFGVGAATGVSEAKWGVAPGEDEGVVRGHPWGYHGGAIGSSGVMGW